MAIAFFRISRSAKRTEVIKDAAPILFNTSYPIAEESGVTIQNNTGFIGEFLDSFGYQVSEDGVEWSATGNVTINEFAAENTPQSTNAIYFSVEDIETIFWNEGLFPINASTDRIKIIGIDGYGAFTFRADPIAVGSEKFMHELPFIYFLTKFGGGIPYFTLTYICGNHLGYNEVDEYTVTINVTTLATIGFVSSASQNQNIDHGDPFTHPYRRKSEIIEISEGFVGGEALITVETDSTFFDLTTESRVAIKIGPTWYYKYAAEIFQFTVPLDDQGKAIVEAEHFYLDRDGATATSSVRILIENINGNPANVAIANEYISLVSYVAAGDTTGGTITEYRAFAEADGFIYAGYNRNGGTYTIKRSNSGIEQFAAGVTNLTTNWDDRLNLTYS